MISPTKTVLVKVVLLMSLLTLQSLLFAASPARSVQLDKNMQLAMLSLSGDNSSVIADLQKSYANKSLKKKPTVFPTDCLRWNSSQINEKARKFNHSIIKYSRKNRIDSNLIKSVITAESCFKTRALSAAGAQGLMQLIPATAKRFGVKNSYDPQHNIRGGVRYLRFLLDRFDGDLRKALAGYNAGEGKVDQYKGVPPFKETRQYVKNVLRIYEMLSPYLSISKRRVKAVYYPPSLGQKPGRHGWKFNRSLAPHLYRQTTHK